MEEPDIYVTKVNQVYVKVYCSDSIHEELRDFFTFAAPDANWSPAFKARKWDGKIRLYNKLTCQLPAGLLRYLITFASERKYSIDFQRNIGGVSQNPCVVFVCREQ